MPMSGHDNFCKSVLAAVCTQDGYMDFQVLADSTVPPLDLDTLKLRDPACKPAFKSSLNDRVWFHVPLSGCGTRYWVSMFPGLMGKTLCSGNALTNAVITFQLDGGKIIYENEVRALQTDLPLRRISRDSEFRCVWMPLRWELVLGLAIFCMDVILTCSLILAD